MYKSNVIILWCCAYINIQVTFQEPMGCKIMYEIVKIVSLNCSLKQMLDLLYILSHIHGTSSESEWSGKFSLVTHGVTHGHMIWWCCYRQEIGCASLDLNQIYEIVMHIFNEILYNWTSTFMALNLSFGMNKDWTKKIIKELEKGNHPI